ncbi:hypothetical protein M9Q43_07170 [Flavobacterium sp. HXWNR29]|uniref:hypothetical protein n=1 Tax=Flavobacterium odoriferum TaxID=2946604 RepID=UPI0021CB88F7|nr:hypothetical protein [Flavobacterium sp. HXWNR29]MCU4188943.1 hypothetical protein [Flavobacterium sp. HXWNR29]
MTEELLIQFPEIIENGCLKSINNKHSFIFDDNETKKGVFVTAHDKFHLHVEKNHSKSLNFIQNDSCVMNSDNGKQCDYVLFDNEKVCFSEIKATKENLSNRRKDALKQLENTIKFYFENNLFKNYQSKNALITFDNNKRIAPQASKSTKTKEFKVKYDVNLNEGNYILFE